MAEDSLLAWTKKQLAWTQDAVRRHVEFGNAHLSPGAKADIVACVRQHGGFSSDPAPTCEPLESTHLKSMATAGEETILCSFGPVENLNRLAGEQQLRFAVNGLTIIYGDNGSGKSGYARIAKKLCRSLTKGELLSDVFKEGAQPPAKVLVRYRAVSADDTKPLETLWVDGTPAPDAISQISVFDSANARFYVDQENRISFLPSEIAVLQRHSEHCSEMDAAFDKDITALDKRIKVVLPGGYTPKGAIASLIARLDPKIKPLPTAEEIKAAAVWTEDDAKELKRLEKLLAHDPAMLGARCRRAKAALESYVTIIPAIESGLSAAIATQLQTLFEIEARTAEAASLAATDRFASEPLQNIGQTAWQLLYDHAKAFAESLGLSAQGLPAMEGDPCVLCQSPLSPEAARRVQSFNEFVAGQAAVAAKSAKEARQQAVQAIKVVAIPQTIPVQLALAEYGGLDDMRQAFVKALAEYFVSTANRRDALLKAASPEEFATLSALTASPLGALTKEIAALESEAAAFEASAKDNGERATERQNHAQLQDRKKLSTDLETVLARLADLEELTKLKQCKTLVERGPISRQITALRRSLVMKNMEKCIFEEIKAFDLTHIPFQVSDRSRDGQSYLGVALDAPSSVANNKVLSEGEQRALALACFLGEVNSMGGKHGIIIDDPVSSLDHIRLRRVAERLVAEADTGRQIIIFTHNIHFFNEVIDAAAKCSPQVPVLKNFISSSSVGFGIISETDEPWIIMSVNKRIEMLRTRLKTFDGVTDFNTDEWRGKAKDFYTDLRETWERLVEEVVLGKVVERFNTDVKTQSLKGVVIEDEDYKTVFWAMARVSELSGHDMATGRALPLAKPTDMKTDLDKLDTFKTDIVKRSKDATKRRKALEEPPAAAVA